MEDMSKGFECGGYTHKIKYIDGPMLDNSFSDEVDLSFFSIVEAGSSLMITGAAENLSWVGTHIISIVGYNGAQDLSPSARGKQGLYNRIDSTSTLILEITNPCATSIVNANGNFVIEQVMSVPFELTLLNLKYDGPSNSASVTYGNGFDKCGPLTYQWLDSEGKEF